MTCKKVKQIPFDELLEKGKKYEIKSKIEISIDGFALGVDVDDVKKRWKDYCLSMCGDIKSSSIGVRIYKILLPDNENYNKEKAPSDEEFMEDFSECLSDDNIY